MPQTLFRLPCGIIYTGTFRNWLRRFHEEGSPRHPHRVLSLDYVRCASGPQRGRAWWQLLWILEDAAPAHRMFDFDGVIIHVPKSAEHGLRERCLDWEKGSVMVRP